MARGLWSKLQEARRSRAARFGERVVLVLLVGALLIVLTRPPSLAHPNETAEQHVARMQREMDRLAKQPTTRCPAEWGALASEKDLRIALFYGYANFDDHVLDAGFAHGMASALELPCRGSIAACGFALDREEPNLLALKRIEAERTVTVDIRWPSVGTSNERNRGADAHRQKEESARTKDAFYEALRDSDVVLYTGHSRAGSGLGFDPSSKLDIAIDMIFRSPAKAIRHALEARPSRLKVFAAMACESDDYYEKEFHAANADASLLLVEGDISSVQTDQIDIGILNALLGERCRAELDESLRSVDEPDVKVHYVKGR
ncbi:MAG TPA: hypothetical protein VGH28_22075 [Polyangiaceae bacterium]|jgi:hypothetical protein